MNETVKGYSWLDKGFLFIFNHKEFQGNNSKISNLIWRVKP